jgi:phosphatidylinositol kinase/protein kinase (PI-3  family)
MAVLEAFVYDPLINWRLLQTNNTDAHGDDPVDEKPGASVCAF